MAALRKLLILSLLFVGKSYGQQIQTLGAKNTRVVAQNQFQVDSLFVLPLRDTTFTPYRAGAMVYRVTDSKFYFYDGSRWRLITYGAAIAESDPTVSAAIKNASAADTLRWGKVYVDSIRRSTDTVYFYTAGVKYFGFKDSVGNVSGKIDSVKRKAASDSVFYYKGATSFFAYRDSIGTGEANTGSNIGIGGQVLQSKVGVDFRFRTLLSANTNLTIAQNTNDLTFTSKSFIDSVRKKSGTDSVFFYINGAGQFAFRDSTIAGGEINTASNQGAGVGIFKSKVGVDLQFKSATSDTTIAITGNTNDVQWKVDQTRIASVKRLQDTATAIRAYIDAGDTIYVKSPGTGYIVGYTDVDSLKIKTLKPKYGVIIDSATAGEIGFKADTASLRTWVGTVAGAGSSFDSTKLNQFRQAGKILYNNSYFTSTSGWTSTGFTPTAVATFLRMSGGDGTFGKYMTLDAYKLADTKRSAEITVTWTNPIASGFFGVALGFRSTNTWYNPSLAAQYDPFTKVIKIIQVNTTTVLKTKYLDYTPAQNDIVKITIIQDGNNFDAYFERRALGSATDVNIDVLSVVGNMDASKNFALPNTAQLAVYEMGGQVDISSMRLSTQMPTTPWITLIGDSKTFGYSVDDPSNSWASGLSKYGIVANYGGDGDRTIEVLQHIDTTLARGGKYALLNIGRNDSVSGVSTATFRANYTSIRNKIVAAGFTLIHVLPIPESPFDQTNIKNWIVSTFAGDLMIDPSTGWDGATMLSSDAVHPNLKGHRYILAKIDSTGYLTYQPNRPYTPHIGVKGIGDYLKGKQLTIGTYPIADASGSLTDGVLSAFAGYVRSTTPIYVNYSGGDEKILLAGTAGPIIRFADASAVQNGYVQGYTGFMKVASTRSGVAVVLDANGTASAALYPNGNFEMPNGGFNLTGVNINLNNTTSAMLFNRLNTTQQTALSTSLYAHFFNTDSLALGYRGASSSNEMYATRNWTRANFSPVEGTYTPTITNVTNVAVSSISTCYYQQVGTAVEVWGEVTIDPTATGDTRLDITLPIASSITNTYDLSGSAVTFDVQQSARIFYTSSKAVIRLNASVDAASHVYSFRFIYKYLAP